MAPHKRIGVFAYFSAILLAMKITAITGVFSLIASVAGASAADRWLNDRIAVLGDFAGLQYSLNPGIAWGIRLPGGIQEALIVLALIAVVYMAKQANDTIDKVGFGMVLGGGAANIIDRLFDGYVTDYFQIGSFPIFNVADSFVTVGVVLVLLDALRDEWINRRRIPR